MAIQSHDFQGLQVTMLRNAAKHEIPVENGRVLALLSQSFLLLFAGIVYQFNSCSRYLFTNHRISFMIGSIAFFSQIWHALIQPLFLIPQPILRTIPRKQAEAVEMHH